MKKQSYIDQAYFSCNNIKDMLKWKQNKTKHENKWKSINQNKPKTKGTETNKTKQKSYCIVQTVHFLGNKPLESTRSAVCYI